MNIINKIRRLVSLQKLIDFIEVFDKYEAGAIITVKMGGGWLKGIKKSHELRVEIHKIKFIRDVKLVDKIDLKGITLVNVNYASPFSQFVKAHWRSWK